MDRQTYTIEEAAAVLGVGRNNAYTAARTGKIPALRIGGRLVVPRQALERLLRGEAPAEETESSTTPSTLKRKSRVINLERR